MVMAAFTALPTDVKARALQKVRTFLAALFTTLAQWFNTPGFDLGSFDWQLLMQVGVGAFIAYLSKNLGSTENGKFFGKIG
jgi:hypothetical protein